MLNTDAHNPMVKNKMSKEGFQKNNRGTYLLRAPTAPQAPAPAAPSVRQGSTVAPTCPPIS
jgi:hypothetical protein